MFLVWISHSKSVKKLQEKKKKSKCKIQDFQHQNPNLDLGNINLKTKDEPSYTTSSAWKSSALLLILNHFLIRDLGHESFTNIIKSQQISMRDNADKQSQWETFKFWICRQPTLLFLEYPSLIFSTALHRDVRYWNLWFCFRLLIEPSGSCLNANKSMELTKIIFLSKENIDTWIISQWKCQEQRKENKKVLNSLKQSREAYVLLSG